jgi:hypothetical protein
MSIVLFFIFAITTVQSYSFCPKCIHHYTTQHSNPTKPNCNLFRNHTLFRDRIDVDFLGKEICTTKGKYFITKKDEEDMIIVAS